MVRPARHTGTACRRARADGPRPATSQPRHEPSPGRETVPLETLLSRAAVTRIEVGRRPLPVYHEPTGTRPFTPIRAQDRQPCRHPRRQGRPGHSQLAHRRRAPLPRRRDLTGPDKVRIATTAYAKTEDHTGKPAYFRDGRMVGYAILGPKQRHPAHLEPSGGGSSGSCPTTATPSPRACTPPAPQPRPSTPARSKPAAEDARPNAHSPSPRAHALSRHELGVLIARRDGLDASRLTTGLRAESTRRARHTSRQPVDPAESAHHTARCSSASARTGITALCVGP